MEWQERIRCFTPEEYNTMTEPMPYGFTTEEGTLFRIVKKVAIYAFNSKWNTLPDAIFGKYIGCGSINNGLPVSQAEVEAVFNDYNKDVLSVTI